jgi:hypothetical protein
MFKSLLNRLGGLLAGIVTSDAGKQILTAVVVAQLQKHGHLPTDPQFK